MTKKFIILVIILILLFPACLIFGSVDIPAEQVFRSLFGLEIENDVWDVIVFESRLPMAITAVLSGAALAVSGLLLQTTFNNPLADPSILGISTGSSLGVAIVILAFGGTLSAMTTTYYASIVAGAIIGATAVMLLLLAFSGVVKSSTMLLIVGILISYLTSSAISLLNFFATQEGVHSFVIWGLGNFSGVTLDKMPFFAFIVIVSLAGSILLIKPLNALLLGNRYAESMGLNITRTRNGILFISSVLTAIITAYCGPIGFIGLVVPHIARLTMHTSNHTVILPATILIGAVTGLLCALISILPSRTEVLPLNAITPIIGVPVIIYIIIERKRLHYFN